MHTHYKLDVYSMMLTTHAGEVKTRTFRERVAYEDYRDSLMTIALTMVQIEEQELYKDDFSSVVEYGEKVFGYKKSAVYNMLKVGRQYLLPDTQKSIFANEDGLILHVYRGI